MSRLVIALAAVLAAAPAAAQEGVRRADGGIMIDFPNTDMRLVVAALAEAAGLNVTYADLPQRTVSLRTSTPVPASQVRVYLESLLRANGMELRDEGGGLLRIVSTGVAAGGGAQPAGAVPVAGAVANQAGLAIFVHPLRHAPAEDVARSIGALFGIGDGAWGGAERPRSLTDELRDQALGPDGVPAPPPSVAAGRALTATLSGPVAIFPDQRTNSLLIRATQVDYQTLAAAITQLDTRPLQVLIEVVIAEVRRDRQFGLGVDFRIADQPVDGTDVLIGGELTGGGAGDAVLRIMRLGAVDANVVLRALSASGNVNILSRPVILAQNNEEARIMVGDQRPFIQISRALPTDNAARDQVIQYRDVGTRLTIRPTINPDGYVTLTVLQEVSSATDVTQFGAPVISTREAETRLLVKDGHTVVIGGLIDEVRTSTASGIPVLKDIPVLGNLFRSTTRRTNTSELFLFLIPHVLYSDDDVDSATQRVRERAPRLDRALPDSIPLYWDIRADTMEAPGRPLGAPVRPAPAATPDGAGEETAMGGISIDSRASSGAPSARLGSHLPQKPLGEVGTADRARLTTLTTNGEMTRTDPQASGGAPSARVGSHLPQKTLGEVGTANRTHLTTLTTNGEVIRMDARASGGAPSARVGSHLPQKPLGEVWTADRNHLTTLTTVREMSRMGARASGGVPSARLGSHLPQKTLGEVGTADREHLTTLTAIEGDDPRRVSRSERMIPLHAHTATLTTNGKTIRGPFAGAGG